MIFKVIHWSVLCDIPQVLLRNARARLAAGPGKATPAEPLPQLKSDSLVGRVFGDPDLDIYNKVPPRSFHIPSHWLHVGSCSALV